MPRAHANGIELEYETFGRDEDPALLLVMGLGAQMILWDEELCGAFVDRGFRVIRFDNRDVGLSTRLDHLGVPNVPAALQAAATGAPFDAPYRLHDMAADAVGLLDALGVERAHVVGASMGGMIAQSLAIQHPERLHSLVSIMSTTGEPDLPGPTPEAMTVLLSPPPREREAYIEQNEKVWRVIGSPGFDADAERIRARAARVWERGLHPEGMARQLVAILASGSRKAALRDVRTPTLVVHGEADPLVPFAGGRDTADAIPGAELIAVPGMGHDLPPAFWPRLVDAVARNAERADI